MKKTDFLKNNIMKEDLYMKRIVKKATAIITAAVTACSSMAICAHAEPCVPHYAGNPVKTKIREISGGTHSHTTVVYPDGKTDTETCWITIYVYEHVTKCMRCNAVIKTTTSSEVVHSVLKGK